MEEGQLSQQMMLEQGDIELNLVIGTQIKPKMTWESHVEHETLKLWGKYRKSLASTARHRVLRLGVKNTVHLDLLKIKSFFL